MFLREGSQLRGMIGAVACAGIALPTAANAVNDTGRSNLGAAVELPREVLPWRRTIEGEADKALLEARRQLELGNDANAERQLQRVVRNFPGTHAATDAGNLIETLLEKRAVASGMRGLGGPHGRFDAKPADTIDPVAGWHPTTKPESDDLSEALLEAAGDRVFFDDGATSLTVPARTVIAKQARWLREKPAVEVRIVGHADDRGTDQSNMRLSHDRAVVVRREFIRRGISPKRLHVFSHGKSSPIAVCALDSCAAQNRRVVTEVKLTQNANATPE